MVQLEIIDQKKIYWPGDTLACQYRICADENQVVQAIETSVLWYTQGKGDEDLGVHFFKRRLRREMSENELDKMHRFSVELPRSPFSYDGLIVQIQWCVRVRLFFKKGGPETYDRPFQLGDVQAPVPPDDAEANGDGT